MADPVSIAKLGQAAAAIRKHTGDQTKGNLECQHCLDMTATCNRQNTSFFKDSMNFATLCPTCQAEADRDNQDAWDEYYANCM